MPIAELPVRLDACDHAEHNVAAVQHGAGDFQDRLPSEFGELAQQLAVESEEQHLCWNRSA